ncbi:oligosaccharyltransferase complex subunit gamma [Kwoniella mangroviensis CBS 10435]|uniref:Oligosaccharyltransferase complex subunit gamma n=1 Tax=Kwoniella mangroviensis CBS 10435 TaxID=1331196 RepID=A0A1B9IKH0_9TREE|nr:oligosaccharyltransferase complex subunit gamma [Kwoniella mangroviensis CBS 10435]
MRLLTILTPLLSLLPLALSLPADQEHWAELSSKSKDGIIKLNSQSYHELLADDREYSVSVVLTALPAQFKCQPCHDFDPSFHQVAASWKRKPKHVRDQHFFAKLDFQDGQAVYQELGLTSAPTVMFHPALTGPNKSNKLSVITYEMNRNGLTAPPLHSFLLNLVPEPFALYKPINPLHYIAVPISLIAITVSLYSMRKILVPLIQSRLVWGSLSIILILTFTSGHMWNKIKNAPYVAAGPNGQISWIAGGYSNQLGLESQVVAGIYGLLGFSIIALTVLIPAQSSPIKQRVGVYLWLGMLIIVFSLLIKLFRMKNGGYPFALLF